MNKIILFGDTHLVDKSPKHEAQIQMLQWMVESFKDDTVIFTGDFWDKPSLHWERSYKEGLDYLLQFNDVHLISGNHEMLGNKGNMLSPLKDKFPNLHIYLEPEEVMIQGNKFLMLPFLYDRQKMVEQYEALEWKGDYIVTHCSPPGKNHGAEEVSFKKCKVKKVYFGHIHEPSDEKNQCVIGVSNTTRNDERLFTKRYIEIVDSKEQSNPMPVFYDIVDIDYESENVTVNPLWEINIKNAPSVRMAKRKFNGLNIRDEGIEVIQITAGKKDLSTVQNFSDSLENDFDEFSKIEGLSERVANTCKEFLFQKSV